MSSRILLTILACSAIAFGQEIQLDLDPARTTVHYTLPATLHTVHGSFKLKHGSIRFDPATGKIGGEVVVDAASGSSEGEGRDRRMHKEILQSATYPEISFAPDRVEGTVAPQGDSDVQVHGTFRLHGSSHEITIPVHVHMADGKASASTRFSIPYVKWGLKNPSTFVLRVSDKVEIDASTGALP